MGFLASFFNLFTDGWFSFFAGLLIVVLLVVVIGIIGWGVFHVLDSWFLPEYRAHGIISGKSHMPARFIPTAVAVPSGSGGTSVIITQQYIPESWGVTVQIGNRAANASCGKSFYNKVSKGDRVIAFYVEGRFSDQLYIRALS